MSREFRTKAAGPRQTWGGGRRRRSKPGVVIGERSRWRALLRSPHRMGDISDAARLCRIVRAPDADASWVASNSSKARLSGSFPTSAMWRPVPARARERSQVQARLTADDEVSDWLATVHPPSSSDGQ
jgi:hypothetical protein